MVIVALFMWTQMVTVGGLHWIYIPECLNDQQFSFVACIHYCNGIEIAMVSEYMFDTLGPDGTFLFYFTVSFMGLIFMFFFLKETHGLSDRQKKQLYMPAQYRDDHIPKSLELTQTPKEAEPYEELDNDSV